MTETVELTPMDTHNRALPGRVHPPDWRNPTPADRYNMVVIGAGTAGLVVAAGVAGLSGKVGLGALAKVIHPYPTMAEAIKGLSDACNRTRLTPFTAGLLKRILRWRR